MSTESLRITILGLTVTSSWGNGHASTYRGLIRALDERGHTIDFLERDVPWYRDNRDLGDPACCRAHLYADFEELRDDYADLVAEADVVIVGSFVPDGVEVAEWALARASGPVAFYDIDTPVTLGKLEEGDEEYLTRELVSEFDLYLSFAGGRALDILESQYGARRARALPCAVDPDQYHPVDVDQEWTLGYLGTYSDDRQPRLEEMLNEPARRLTDSEFVVAGPQYPDDLVWPSNVRRIDHVPPPEHAGFYSAQAWTLNVTRDDMRELGHSPSVRLFEAAACGTPVISDPWEGLEAYFSPGCEILVAESSEEVVEYLTELDDRARREIGQCARGRALTDHTPDRRAAELEAYFEEAS